MRKFFCPLPNALCEFRSGPLDAHLHGYADLLCQQHYCNEAGWDKIQLVSELGRWLARKHVNIELLDEQHVAAFLGRRSRRMPRHSGDQATLTLLLKYLRQHHVIPARLVNTPLSPIDVIAQKYQRFLFDERGLGQNTVKAYIAIVRRFLSHCFPDGKAELDTLCAKHIAMFVLHDTILGINRRSG